MLVPALSGSLPDISVQRASHDVADAARTFRDATLVAVHLAQNDVIAGGGNLDESAHVAALRATYAVADAAFAAAAHALSLTSSPFNSLPRELILHILDHCDGETLVACRAVCREWRDVLHKQRLRFAERLMWHWYGRFPADSHPVESAGQRTKAFGPVGGVFSGSTLVWTDLSDGTTPSRVSQYNFRTRRFATRDTPSEVYVANGTMVMELEGPQPRGVMVGKVEVPFDSDSFGCVYNMLASSEFIVIFGADGHVIIMRRGPASSDHVVCARQLTELGKNASAYALHGTTLYALPMPAGDARHSMVHSLDLCRPFVPAAPCSQPVLWSRLPKLVAPRHGVLVLGHSSGDICRIDVGNHNRVTEWSPLPVEDMRAAGKRVIITNSSMLQVRALNGHTLYHLCYSRFPLKYSFDMDEYADSDSDPEFEDYSEIDLFAADDDAVYIGVNNTVSRLCLGDKECNLALDNVHLAVNFLSGGKPRPDRTALANRVDDSDSNSDSGSDSGSDPEEDMDAAGDGV